MSPLVVTVALAVLVAICAFAIVYRRHLSLLLRLRRWPDSNDLAMARRRAAQRHAVRTGAARPTPRVVRNWPPPRPPRSVPATPEAPVVDLTSPVPDQDDEQVPVSESGQADDAASEEHHAGRDRRRRVRGSRR
jgi:hypothetical protein